MFRRSCPPCAASCRVTPSSSAIARARLERIGREGEPLLIIEAAVSDPGRLVDIAAQDAAFQDPSSGENFYPGRRAPAPLDYVAGLARALDPLIRESFGLEDVGLARANCTFSLATLSPQQLNLAQRLPHVDTVDPLQFAILHYLCGPAFGGTAFYRHRATGFETLTAERLETYQTTLDRELASAPPSQAYVDGDTDHFVRTHRQDAAFNRVIVYRSRTLHSGHIPDPALLSDDPRRGRLTANVFLTYGRKA